MLSSRQNKLTLPSFYLNSDIFPFTEESGVPPHGLVRDVAGGGDGGGAGGAVDHRAVVRIALGLPAIEMLPKQLRISPKQYR